MQEDHEMMEFHEHLTDGEIMRTIRYLDSDLYPDKAGEKTGTAIGRGIALLTALAGALTYIGVYGSGSLKARIGWSPKAGSQRRTLETFVSEWKPHAQETVKMQR
jgi:hypothetical protein